MIRYLKYKSLLLRRNHPRSKNTLLAKLLHSQLVVWDMGTASRGVAIGMFWAFIPIPFQMLPASLFCWMIRGNLPIALLCVWITNPITLPPVLLFEYRVGELVLDTLLKSQASGFVDGSTTFSAFAGGLRNILTGGLVTSCVMMVVSYLFIVLSFNISHLSHKKQRARYQRKIARTRGQAVPQNKGSGRLASKR